MYKLLLTWGCAGEGASGCWTNIWLCSGLDATIAIPPLRDDGTWWVSEALSLCKENQVRKLRQTDLFSLLYHRAIWLLTILASEWIESPEGEIWPAQPITGGPGIPGILGTMVIGLANWGELTQKQDWSVESWFSAFNTTTNQTKVSLPILQMAFVHVDQEGKGQPGHYPGSS